jgi:sugar transferase (PEP-CTERM/EpsH1 system associated)
MEHGVLKLVNGLDPRGVSSAICSTAPADPAMVRLVGADVRLFQLDRRPGNDPALVWRLYRLFRRERPHIVHTHAWGTLLEGWAAARLARVPVLVHGEHGTLQLRQRQVWAQRWGWRQADRLLSVSSRLAERMAREIGFPQDRITVIRNGVDVARFSPVEPGPRLAARRSLGLGDGVLVGTVGRLVDVKNQEGLLVAIAELRRAGLDVSGAIVGDGPLRGHLEERIAALGLVGSVRLLGHRQDIETVYAAFDVFCLPSKSEGMSNTILEAMASGLPVVATRVGGADELVLHDQTGLLVPGDSGRALVAALAELVREPARRAAFGREGRRRAVAEFSLDRMLGNYLDFYTMWCRQ